MWRYAGQSVIGTKHQRTGMPCQDAHRIEVLEDHVLVAVIADGAGSAAHADVAAPLITRESMRQFADWESFPQTAEEWDIFIRNLTERIRQTLVAKAKDFDCPLHEFAATMLLVAVSEKALAGMQIGDGAIVYGVKGEEVLKLLCVPEQGEYLNETVFLVSDTYQEHIQTAYIADTIDRISLFSDGLQRLALNMQSQPPQPHLPFFAPFFEFLQTIDDSKAREQQLHEFLLSPRICSRTDDDKTLVLAFKEKFLLTAK